MLELAFWLFMTALSLATLFFALEMSFLKSFKWWKLGWIGIVVMSCFMLARRVLTVCSLIFGPNYILEALEVVVTPMNLVISNLSLLGFVVMLWWLFKKAIKNL